MKLSELFRKKTQPGIPAPKMELVSIKMPGPYVDIRYYVQWPLHDGSVRKPEEYKGKYKNVFPISVAGKEYKSIRELSSQRIEEQYLCRDIHGREVFEYKERFPCFDSFDYLHENRYFRWFYILDGDRLFCLYCADDRDELEITEDVRRIKEGAWKKMKELDWLGCAGQEESI